MGQDRRFVQKRHWKQVWWACKLGGVRSQGIIWVGLTVLARDSDMASICWLCGGKPQQKNHDFCQLFSVGESCPSSSYPDAKQFTFLLYVPELLSYIWAQSKRVQINPLGLLRKMSGTQKSFCLTQPQSLLVFTARNIEGFSSWHWNSGLGSLVWNRDPFFPREGLNSWDISPDFYLPYVGMGPTGSVSLPLLPASSVYPQL